jgi:hypothetical protein
MLVMNSIPVLLLLKRLLVPENPQATDLWGFFDGFEDGRFLTGWVQDRNDPGSRSIEIQIELSGKVVAIGAPTFEREMSLPGYKIYTGNKITAFDIVDSRVKVYGVGRDGRKTSLTRWAPLNRALMARLFPREQGADD